MWLTTMLEVEVDRFRFTSKEFPAALSAAKSGLPSLSKSFTTIETSALLSESGEPAGAEKLPAAFDCRTVMVPF